MREPGDCSADTSVYPSTAAKRQERLTDSRLTPGLRERVLDRDSREAWTVTRTSSAPGKSYF